MPESISHKILLVGLPSTGKTSFLAALWHMVNQTTTDCVLRLEKLEGDRAHLNMIRDAWLRYQPVPRTKVGSEKVVSMILNDRIAHTQVELIFPDLSGESFRLQWKARQFTVEYDRFLQDANGGILFVHPENIVKPIRIDTVNSLVQDIGNTDSPMGQPEVQVAATTTPWDIESAPTQVQLVELLQFIAGREHFQAPFRLAIIVSAWDIVAPIDGDPKHWISRELPLLEQFINSNKHSFDIAFYGISAQGGHYQSSETDDLKTTPPSHRVAIVGQNVKNSHDITEPIQWLIR